MSKREWYIHQNNQQAGPFDLAALKQWIQNHGTNPQTLIFRAGWTQWRPHSECLSELSQPTPLAEEEAGLLSLQQDKSHSEISQLEPLKQKRAPRNSVQGQIIVHNNDNLIFAQSVNISVEGLFIKTDKPIFNIGEILKVTCRIKAIGTPFNAEAQVVRRANKLTEPSGYGLFFTSLAPHISQRIHALLEQAQPAS